MWTGFQYKLDVCQDTHGAFPELFKRRSQKLDHITYVTYQNTFSSHSSASYLLRHITHTARMVYVSCVQCVTHIYINSWVVSLPHSLTATQALCDSQSTARSNPMTPLVSHGHTESLRFVQLDDVGNVAVLFTFLYPQSLTCFQRKVYATCSRQSTCNYDTTAELIFMTFHFQRVLLKVINTLQNSC